MLKKLIIVDYVDGSGGEYFANVLNSHAEFNCAVDPMAEDMQKVSDVKLKWFNSNGLVCQDWDENFKAHCEKFLTECRTSRVNSIAIPYHLYKYPHHVKILKSLSNHTRFVSIHFHKHQKLVALDYIRKILLRPFTKNNMSEISFYSQSLSTESKQQLINLLKQGKLYGIDLELWLSETIDTLKKYTDRPIEIRRKAPIRMDRSVKHTIYDQLDDNVFALVTYNSIAATEAVAYGIPAFTLAPNAANYVCSTDLSKIETPFYLDQDQVRKWCCFLSYGQFNNEELANGDAWRIFSEYS